METGFPKDLVSRSHMNFINEKFRGRLDIFKGHRCFPILEQFYINYITCNNSRNEEELNKNYNLAIEDLKNFTLCWESNRNIKGNEHANINKYE
jgi:hypothetical protein